jgi:NADPH-dependent glutamate synthase beta subunit-like oxidoreductase
MKIDASTLPAGAQLEADVAVVGAGPAGIASRWSWRAPVIAWR